MSNPLWLDWGRRLRAIAQNGLTFADDEFDVERYEAVRAIAAEKGHDVTITDKADKVGGQLAIASNGPWGDEEFMRLVDYLEGYCQRGGVKFELGKAVTEKESEETACIFFSPVR